MGRVRFLSLRRCYRPILAVRAQDAPSTHFLEIYMFRVVISQSILTLKALCNCNHPCSVLTGTQYKTFTFPTQHLNTNEKEGIRVKTS
jgi:hypothetical protein